MFLSKPRCRRFCFFAAAILSIWYSGVFLLLLKVLCHSKESIVCISIYIHRYRCMACALCIVFLSESRHTSWLALQLFLWTHVAFQQFLYSKKQFILLSIDRFVSVCIWFSVCVWLCVCLRRVCLLDAILWFRICRTLFTIISVTIIFEIWSQPIYYFIDRIKGRERELYIKCDIAWSEVNSMNNESKAKWSLNFIE